MAADIFKERRTIREFKVKPISENDLHDILDAARWAPSAGNLQNWRFIVVKDPDQKQEVAAACLDQYWMADAPIIVVVCSQPEKMKETYGEQAEIYAIQSSAAAIENLLLSAWSKGIGSAWVGAFSEEELKRILGIPEGIDIHAVIALGYPRLVPRPPSRLKLSDVTFYGGYGSTAEPGILPVGPKVEKTAQDVIHKLIKKKRR